MGRGGSLWRVDNRYILLRKGASASVPPRTVPSSSSSCAYLSWMSTSCQGGATSVKAADDSEDISERHGGRKLLLMSDVPTFPLSSAAPDTKEVRLNDGLSETGISHITMMAVLQGWTSTASTFGEEESGVSRDAGCLVLPRLSTHQHYP